MNLENIRREIERMRTQVMRQRKDIRSLEKAGISTKSAHELLERMQSKIAQLCAERDRMVKEMRITAGERSGAPTVGTVRFSRS